MAAGGRPGLHSELVGPATSMTAAYDYLIVCSRIGRVDEEAARVLTSEAADRIEDLVRLGVPFDTLHGEIALAREGAHSLPRVLHPGGDPTGAHMEPNLSS